MVRKDRYIRLGCSDEQVPDRSIWGSIMLGNDRARHRDRFDFEEWLDSIDGETIVLGGTDGPAYLRGSAIRRPSLCGNCQETVMKVARKGQMPLDCPLCGQRLGAIEARTNAIDSWEAVSDGRAND